MKKASLNINIRIFYHASESARVLMYSVILTLVLIGKVKYIFLTAYASKQNSNMIELNHLLTSYFLFFYNLNECYTSF